MLIENIRLKANECYVKILLNNELNDKKRENIEEIIKFLKDDNCFIKVNIKFALLVLISIGYTKEEAKELYVKLINESKKILKGKYKLINPQDLGLK